MADEALKPITLPEGANAGYADAMRAGYTITLDQGRAIVQALRLLPEGCRYHGTNFERLGVEPWGEPRCDSCKAPWRRKQALAHLLGPVEELTA